MKIQTKILGGYVIIATLTILIALIAIYQMGRLQEKFATSEQLSQQLRLIDEIVDKTWETRFFVERFLLLHNPDDNQWAQNSLHQLRLLFNQAYSRETNPQRLEQYNTILNLMSPYDQKYQNLVIRISVLEKQINAFLESTVDLEHQFNNLEQETSFNEDIQFVIQRYHQSFTLLSSKATYLLFRYKEEDIANIISWIETILTIMEDIHSTVEVFDEDQAEKLEILVNSLEEYLDSFEGVTALIGKINEEIEQTIFPIAPKILSASHNISNSHWSEEVQSTNELKSSIEYSMQLIMLLTFLTFLLGVGLGIIFSIRFTQPIITLEQSALKLAQGELQQPIEVTSTDELGSLARSFIQMRDAIRTKIEDLNQLNKTVEEHNRTLQETNRSIERFVPQKFLQFINKESILDVELGDQVEKNMSILFSDIRQFTALSEHMTPEENFRFINSYLEQMAPVITRHNGYIDKYIGDAIMALFSRTADDAVQAAIDMLHHLRDYNQMRQRAGYAPIDIGLGINTGMLMLGTIGGKDRIDGTVIGDAVNVASRLEGLTKLYNTPLLIGNDTFLNLKHVDRYSIRMLDRVQVKGKENAVMVYEVFDADPPEIKNYKLATRELYEKAWMAYQYREFGQASELFQRCYDSAHQDQAAKIFARRCQNLIQFGVSEEWDGTTHVDEK